MITLSISHSLKLLIRLASVVLLSQFAITPQLFGQLAKKNNKTNFWLNQDSTVKYGGSGACEPCHQDISEKFSRHGMARTFKAMSEQNEIADWGGTQIVKDHATG